MAFNIDPKDLNLQDAAGMQLVEVIRNLAKESGAGSGLSDEAKQALMDCFENVAWVNDDGQDYYNALYEALFGTTPVTPTLESISAVFNQGTTVIYDTDSLNTLKQYLVVTATYSDSSTETVNDYTLSGTLTAGTSTITVSYQGKSDTFTVNVTATPTLVSISAVFTQGDNVFCTVDTLDTLRQYLVVTATYADSTTETVSDYTLSGTLTAGTSTITVSYDGETDTFAVTNVRAANKLFTNVVWNPFGTSNTYSIDGSADGTLVAAFNTTASTTAYTTGVGVDSTTPASAFKTFGDIKGHRVRCYYNSEWISGGNSESNFTVSCYIGGFALNGERKKYCTIQSIKNTTADGFADVLVPSSAGDFATPWAGTGTVTDSDYFSVRHYWLTSVAGNAKFTISVYDLGSET